MEINYRKNDSGLTEELKEKNQLLWVGNMNNYKNIAREIVLDKFVYCYDEGGFFDENVETFSHFTDEICEID